MFKKFDCVPGKFTCKFCETTYAYSDLWMACEGRPNWLKDDPDSRLFVLDKLKAEIGEKVLITQFHGEDYAPEGYKQGSFLSYRWGFIRDRRVVPGSFLRGGERYLHFVEYRIDSRSQAELDTFGDLWDVSYQLSTYAANDIFGSKVHVWTKAGVEEQGHSWPNYVTSISAGEHSKELLIAKKQEGFYIYDSELA